MIRKSDTSGEYFNSADELIEWVKANFTAEEFCDPREYHGMIQKLTDYLVNPNF
jgi:hypothetical protein